MKKYASEFNELIVLAKEEKSKKKGGSMAAVLKLVMDLAEFEGNIQEAMDAQEMTENRTQIEGFLQDIDKMYEVLLSMAKNSIQAMRSERANPQLEDEEKMDAPPAPATQEPSGMSFSKEDLQRHIEAKPRSPVTLDIPKIPKM